jgi:hypothetical protein
VRVDGTSGSASPTGQGNAWEIGDSHLFMSISRPSARAHVTSRPSTGRHRAHAAYTFNRILQRLPDPSCPSTSRLLAKRHSGAQIRRNRIEAH